MAALMLLASIARADVLAPQFGYRGPSLFWLGGGSPQTSGPLLSLASPILDLLQAGDVLYAARGSDGLSVIDVTTPTHPREVFRCAQGHAVYYLARRDNLLLLGLADKTVLVYSLGNRRQPRYLRTFGPEHPERPDVPQASEPVAPRPFIAQVPATVALTANAPWRPLRPRIVWEERRWWGMLVGGGVSFGLLYAFNLIGYASSPKNDCPPLWPLAIPLLGPWISLGKGCDIPYSPAREGAGLGFGLIISPVLILDGLAQSATFVVAILGLTVPRRGWVYKHALQLAPLRTPGGSGLIATLQF